MNAIINTNMKCSMVAFILPSMLIQTTSMLYLTGTVNLVFGSEMDCLSLSLPSLLFILFHLLFSFETVVQGHEHDWIFVLNIWNVSSTYLSKLHRVITCKFVIYKKKISRDLNYDEIAQGITQWPAFVKNVKYKLNPFESRTQGLVDPTPIVISFIAHKLFVLNSPFD